jgi:Flp pilus assembly CpaF family ATPase
VTAEQLQEFVPPASGLTEDGQRPAAWPASGELAALTATGGDWSVVREIRQAVAVELSERLGRTGALDPAAQRELARSLIARQVAGWSDQRSLSGQQAPDADGERALAEAVLAEIFGLGRLQALVDDDEIENIQVCGYDRVWCEYADGSLVEGPPVAESDDDLIEMLQNAATYLGQTARSFSTAAPTLRLRLPDGSRLTALMQVSPRPVVAIRRHRLADVDLDDLVGLGSLDAGLAAFLQSAMRVRANIVVTGSINVGKSTMLRALAAEIDRLELVLTIEKEYELHLHEQPDRHPRVVALEAREGNAERGAGAVGLAELVEHGLRLNPRRMIIGEVLGDEIVPTLRTLAAGTAGSLTSIHARSARGVFDRIAELAMTAPAPLPVQAAHYLAANSIDYVLHLEMADERGIGGRLHRFAASLLEVVGVGETGRPATNEIYTPDSDGRAVPTGTLPSPPRLTALTRAGYDPGFLSQPGGGWQRPLDLLVSGGPR